MSTKLAKLIFYGGTITSALLFLILTFDTHRQIAALTNADQLSEQVVAGKRAFQKYNCNDCHTILGFGGYYAPDLTKVYQRRGEKYIQSVLTQPEKLLAKSFRKMPQQHITEQEKADLIAFFKWVNEIDTNDWPPQDSKKRRPSGVDRLVSAGKVTLGAALFKENGCFDCHKIGGVGGSSGPALDDVGSRLDIETMKKQITAPESINPDTEMPAVTDLSDADLQALVDFLAKQKGGQE